MKRIVSYRAVLIAACVLLLPNSFALAKDVHGDLSVAKTVDAKSADAKQDKIEAGVGEQLKDLVKFRRTREGWLGDGTFPEGVTIFKDLAYGEEGGSDSQKLDLYVPTRKISNSNSSGKRKNLTVGCPLVVWIHGGGWRSGDKKGGPMRPLLNAGFAVASINYRLSGEAKWPAQLDDCRTALAFLRAHARDYGIDVKHMGVWGASAGGHLALMLALAGDNVKADTPGLAAVCDWFGPTDLAGFLRDRESTSLGVSMVQQLFGLEGEALLSAAEAASPITYVGRLKQISPLLIMHGKADKLVSIKQSEKLVDKLKAQGVMDVKLEELSGGHGFPGFTAGTIFDVIRFFKNRLL